MTKKIGDNYNAFAGETLDISKTATRQDGTEISDVESGKLSIQQGLTSTSKTCTVVGSEVSATLTEDDTKGMLGRYVYIITVKDSLGKNIAIAHGWIDIAPSPLYGVGWF